MFETRGSAAFATMGDLKMRARQTIEKAQEKPVYLLRDGEPVGGIVSLRMLEFMNDMLEEKYISGVAERRLHAIDGGEDDLIDEDEFWARADAIVSER